MMRRSGWYEMQRLPSNRKELRLFIGIASYYRRFIKGFAKKASPLTEKTSENVSFEWTDSMQNAFEALKEALTTAPVLAYLTMRTHLYSRLTHRVRQSEQYYSSWMWTAGNIVSTTQVEIWRVLRRIIRHTRAKTWRFYSRRRSSANTCCVRNLSCSRIIGLYNTSSTWRTHAEG